MIDVCMEEMWVFLYSLAIALKNKIWTCPRFNRQVHYGLPEKLCTAWLGFCSETYHCSTEPFKTHIDIPATEAHKQRAQLGGGQLLARTQLPPRRLPILQLLSAARIGDRF
jgi:hypothetical protein